MPVSVFKLDRSIRVTPDLHGSFGELGPGGASQSVGLWTFHFVPDMSFVGDLTVVGRISEDQAAANLVAFVPTPYRIGSLNNVAQITAGQGWPWVSASISQNALFSVPANAVDVGIFFNCTAGFGWLYCKDVNGPSAM